ncbi:MAG: type II toxin-antitoxin system VapC family toxin [Symploca sp. SIO1B1]|nr:type II toxin-antitoxin system VapC family toxin [Symploca sp. SIO1C2]NER94055.1 type II toxin-antitoxin system VapC family toxin [Symploca sp. SIO1B1]
MSTIVLLDSGLLGMVTTPKAKSPIYQECKLWFNSLGTKGYTVVLPEIADYQVRRELLSAGQMVAVRRLNQLKAIVTYCPITTEVMLKAAELWAQVGNRGKPTADPNAIDGDVILAAQAKLLVDRGNEVIVATTNVGRLSQFVDAREWQLI